MKHSIGLQKTKFLLALLLKDGTTKNLELFEMVETDDVKISPLEDYDSHSFFTIIGYCKKR